jgi:sugar phosphate isomerase/epimerase
MQLGFLTAPFPDTNLYDVADWAAANGFSALEIACWPRTGGESRRYAGTSHIDVAKISDSEAKDTVAALEAKGIMISGLGYYPNPLHADEAHRTEVIDHLKTVITGGFEARGESGQHLHGRRSPPESRREFRTRRADLPGYRAACARQRRDRSRSKTAR